MTTAAEFFTDLVRAETRLYNAVAERLRAVHNLSLGQYELMQIIGARPDCRVQDIVAEVDITVGAASKAVDRLESAGWCVRSAHPTDRRSSILALTAEGARTLAAARPTFEEEVAARVGVLEPEVLAQAAAALATLRASLERPADRI